MYRSDLSSRDKSGAIFAVAAVHALLFVMLLHLSGRVDLTEPQSVLRVFDVTQPPPPPEIVQPEPRQKPRPKDNPAPASPHNVSSKPTEVAAPRPEISLPVPVPVETAKTPGEGAQSTQGASTAGPGTGSGGAGTGSGAGGAGNGSGGAGGYVTSPHLLTPVLTGRDFTQQLLRSWPRGAPLFLRLRISPAGLVSQCIVDRGTGNPAIDSTVCDMVRQRFRYSPALDSRRQAVAGWAGYRQVPPR